MKITIKPGRLSGKVCAPPSKSMAHRLLICAALAGGESKIENISYSQDILATLDCLEAMGVKYTLTADSVTVQGMNGQIKNRCGILNCRESGSTLRFFVPLCLLSEGEFTLKGSPRLMARPLEIFEDICRKQSLGFSRGEGTVTVRGVINPGEFTVRGDISSQFITGLMFILPLCKADSVIKILPPLESRSYLDLTVSALKKFGVKVIWQDEFTVMIPGNQKYNSCTTAVEGDYSNAAFLSALKLLGHDVEVEGLQEDSLQGDKIYREYFKALENGSPTLSLANCPDLGPVLIAVAAAKNGVVLTDTHRLKIKESDRGVAMATELEKMGAEVILEENRITVIKKPLKTPKTTLSSHNDHRIAMSLAVLLTLVGGSIDGAQAANKSYPDFYDALKLLKAEVTTDEA